MRKLLIAIMAALMLALPLSASISSDPAFLRVRGLEMPVSARMAGMGMAGISSVKGYDALNYNPAALADSGFTLTLPYVNVTLYNTASMLTSGIIDAALALPGATEENQQELADALMDSADIFAQSLGTYNKVANIEAGVGFTAGGFGFNFYIIDSVHSYNAGAGSLASLSLINRLNAAISIGYGHRISFPYGYSLDIGAAVRFSYLAFTETIGAASLMSDFNGMLNTTPMYYGWAVPIDIAVRGNFPLGFSTTVALRNINGFYYMNQAPISSWAGDLFAFGNFETVYTPMSLDVGVSWTYDDIWWFHPTIALDFVDADGVFLVAVAVLPVLEPEAYGRGVGDLASAALHLEHGFPVVVGHGSLLAVVLGLNPFHVLIAARGLEHGAGCYIYGVAAARKILYGVLELVPYSSVEIVLDLRGAVGRVEGLALHGAVAVAVAVGYLVAAGVDGAAGVDTVAAVPDVYLRPFGDVGVRRPVVGAAGAHSIGVQRICHPH